MEQASLCCLMKTAAGCAEREPQRNIQERIVAEMTLELIAAMAILVMAVGGVAMFAAIVIDRSSDEATSLPDLHLWKDGVTPFTIIMHEDFSTELDHYMSGAIQIWQRAVPGLVVDLGQVSTGEAIPVLPHTEFDGWDELKCCQFFAYTHILMDAETNLMQSAAVYVNVDLLPKLSVREIERGLAHEIGHAAGLAHDDDKRSVMYGTSVEGPYGITAKDRAFLTGHYGLAA